MITLICGVGRSGKTTYSKAFENVIHSDLMGHFPERYDNVIRAVTGRSDVVVEGIYGDKKQRARLIESYKGVKRCIWLDTSEEVVKERMMNDRIPISKHHFDFDPPTFEEGWDEIVIIRGNDHSKL